MKGAVLPPKDTGPGSSDKPILDEGLLCLAEEAYLTGDATAMIRRHKRIMLLHYGTASLPGYKSPAARKKCPARIPSSIDETDLRERLMHKLLGEEIFLRDDLTLASLAYELDIEPHHLSRFLSISLKTCFNDIVNVCRVDRAKILLSGDLSRSILDIAFASGFNSKASFNRIFKKTTGVTPRQYRTGARQG
jgi:AraC-like DNA-binding protein